MPFTIAKKTAYGKILGCNDLKTITGFKERDCPNEGYTPQSKNRTESCPKSGMDRQSYPHRGIHVKQNIPAPIPPTLSQSARQRRGDFLICLCTDCALVPYEFWVTFALSNGICTTMGRALLIPLPHITAWRGGRFGISLICSSPNILLRKLRLVSS